MHDGNAASRRNRQSEDSYETNRTIHPSRAPCLRRSRPRCRRARSALFAEDLEIKIEQRRLKDVGTLHLKLKPSLAAIRSDAPFWIDVELESTYPDLMEGKLDFTFADAREVRLRLRTAPLAVPNGDKSFRVFLPAMWSRSQQTSFKVHVVFQGPRRGDRFGGSRSRCPA